MFSKILHYCLEGLIGAQQQESLFLALDALHLSISYEVEIAGLEDLEDQLKDAYARLEQTWPLAVMTIILHIVMVHGAQRIKRAGGTKLSHMFYMEDMFGVLIAGHAPSVSPYCTFYTDCLFPALTVLDRGVWQGQEAISYRDKE